MTRWIDNITSVALLVMSWAELEAVFACITAAFLLIITIARYGYKLYQKLRDKKLTQEEREELKQDTAQLIEDTAAIVVDIKNHIGDVKNNGTDNKEDTPRKG